jgi:mediator of RNA polymerase II transcription subunit 17, fungi type
MEDLPWKSLKLSLERPYKDDNGDEIPVLFDISQDGQHIYEPYVR